MLRHSNVKCDCVVALWETCTCMWCVYVNLQFVGDDVHEKHRKAEFRRDGMLQTSGANVLWLFADCLPFVRIDSRQHSEVNPRSCSIQAGTCCYESLGWWGKETVRLRVLELSDGNVCLCFCCEQFDSRVCVCVVYCVAKTVNHFRVSCKRRAFN